MSEKFSTITENEYRQVRSTFERFSPIPDDLWQDMRPHWNVKSYQRNAFICQEGEVERYFYFVLEGIQRIYVLTEAGEEHILGFSFPGDFSGIYDSFSFQRPAQYYLQAIRPSRLLAISHSHLEALYDKHPALDRWGRLFHLAILVGRGQREVEMLTMTAPERYQRFIARMPEALNKVPQKYLASYLGMKAETFSRLRSAKK